MPNPSYLVLLVILYLLASLVSCDDERQDDVIDLQELLKNVSTALEATKAQLKISELGRAGLDKVYPLDCYDLYLSGSRVSGEYFVQPLGYEEPFQVFCDQMTDGGGWTVFQRRGDYGYPEDYFFKTWKEYKEGFGHLRKEFWLGNDKISALSLQRDNQLRVDLRGMYRGRSHAKYNQFWVENEQNEYELHVNDYSGIGGVDSLRSHTLQKFSTKDVGGRKVCAKKYKGGWWYDDSSGCQTANLNGLNRKGMAGEGIVWTIGSKDSTSSKYSFQYSEMKMKPAPPR